MKNKKTIGLAAVAALVVGATALVISANADAAGGQNKFKQNRFSEDQKTQIDQAFANKDYAAWKKVAGENSKIASKINESNFSKFAQMHDHMKKANDIRKELGLDQIHKGKFKKGMEMHGKFKGKNAAATKAVENNDFEAWKKAVNQNTKMLKAIDTQEKFAKLVLSHKYAQDGDYDKAKEVKKELFGEDWTKKAGVKR